MSAARERGDIVADPPCRFSFSLLLSFLLRHERYIMCALLISDSSADAAAADACLH